MPLGHRALAGAVHRPHPAIAQAFWTEHSERSVLPTDLSVLEVTGVRYLCPFPGAGLPSSLKFAVAALYHTLDEREVASSFQDWLKDRHSLPEETATEVAEKLAEAWRTGAVKVDQAPPGSGSGGR